ncbi:MAG: hypothetical protein WB678_09570, partial [Stellaceae bacterium]
STSDKPHPFAAVLIDPTIGTQPDDPPKIIATPGNSSRPSAETDFFGAPEHQVKTVIRLNAPAIGFRRPWSKPAAGRFWSG